MIPHDPTELELNVARMIAGDDVVALVAAAGPAALSALEAVEEFVNSPAGHAYCLYRQAFDAVRGGDDNDWIDEIDRTVAGDVDRVLTKIAALIAWLDVSAVESGPDLTEDYQAVLDAAIDDLRARTTQR